MRLAAQLLRLGLVAGLAACTTGDGTAEDPLATLASGELSSSFTRQDWSEEAWADSALWRRAVALCRQESHRQLPNCQAVLETRFILSLRRAAERRAEHDDGLRGVSRPEDRAEVLDPAAGPPALEPPAETETP